jgi:hypothetical protein
MRDTRNIKRASKYCQQFFFMPSGGGAAGKDAVGGAASIHRAKETSSVSTSGTVQVASRIWNTGYALEAHIPAAALAGFDPDEHPRIGLFYILEDIELGQQFLTVGDDLNWHIDPSTWATAVLQ